MARNLSFLLFKSTRIGTILKKRYACGGLYAADFKIFFVKVDLVTIRYISQINGGLQPKQLNSLTTINRFSYLSGREITHYAAVSEVPGSILGYDKKYYVCLFVLLLMHTLLFCAKQQQQQQQQQQQFFIKCCHSFCNAYSFGTLSILQNV